MKLKRDSRFRIEIFRLTFLLFLTSFCLLNIIPLSTYSGDIKVAFEVCVNTLKCNTDDIELGASKWRKSVQMFIDHFHSFIQFLVKVML